jgi:HEPN domain-containing protein
MMDRKASLIDWEAFNESYRNAKGFHHRAEQFLREGQCYSVVFNVASVSLECYLVALCKLYGVDPDNHNYTCLMDTIESMMDFPTELNKEIRSLDLIFGICSLKNYHHGVPEPSDSDRILSMCNEVQELFDPARMVSAQVAFENNKK